MSGREHKYSNSLANLSLAATAATAGLRSGSGSLRTATQFGLMDSCSFRVCKRNDVSKETDGERGQLTE